ncbi:MAG: hypothetical protein WA383_01205 [Terriglobales bacterium]|jgi:hypothetical protein
MTADEFTKLPLVTIPFIPGALSPNIISVGDVLKSHSSKPVTSGRFVLCLPDDLRNQEGLGFPPAAERLHAADFTTFWVASADM